MMKDLFQLVNRTKRLGSLFLNFVISIKEICPIHSYFNVVVGRLFNDLMDQIINVTAPPSKKNQVQTFGLTVVGQVVREIIS